MNVRFRSLKVAAVTGLAVLATACSEAAASNTEITVYATPTCGCCSGWVEHLRANGFTVKVVHQDDLSGVRAAHKLPAELTSCHMGVVQGFAVEGHVPADAVHRLLREKPAVLGIAVPGMPAGSPGMERPDGYVAPFEVYSYDAAGRISVFDSRR